MIDSFLASTLVGHVHIIEKKHRLDYEYKSIMGTKAAERDREKSSEATMEKQSLMHTMSYS